MPNASIKNEDMYDQLRGQGRRVGWFGAYDSWTVPELRARAKELGLTGYSALSKSDLVFELRNH